jgi:hypothetical protein
MKETDVFGTCSIHVETFRLERNIQIACKGIGHENLYGFHVQFKVLVNTKINLEIP